MYSSPRDPSNSVGNWFTDRTAQATRPQDWTPEANLYQDYLKHAASTGVLKKDQLGIRAFSAEIRAICRRQPRKSMAARFPGGAATLVYFWPRVIRAPKLLAA